MFTTVEENYLKAFYHLTQSNMERAGVGTNELALHLDVKPATVNDMLKKLKAKGLVDYEKYGRIHLTEQGQKEATEIVRKHRLWETFLYEKLEFSWDEVHEVAEQLEHIHSPKLIMQLDKLLNFPEYDPHGDPIPRFDGTIPQVKSVALSDISVGQTVVVTAVKDTSNQFLQYLDRLKISLGTVIEILDQIAFDGSMIISFQNQSRTQVSKLFADNLLVQPMP